MIAFDVLAAAHRLEEAGMNRRQAEAIIGTARDAATAGEPATRADLAATAAPPPAMDGPRLGGRGDSLGQAGVTERNMQHEANNHRCVNPAGP